MTPGSLTLLFLCGAVLSLVSAAAGAILCMWAQHVSRTGCSPLPSAPRISLFKRKTEDEDEDTDKPKARRVGP